MVPAFVRKGDLLYMDEGVHFTAAVGSALARGATRAFPHQDYAALEEQLRQQVGRPPAPHTRLGGSAHCGWSHTPVRLHSPWLSLRLHSPWLSLWLHSLWLHCGPTPCGSSHHCHSTPLPQAAADLVLPPHKRHRLFLLVEGVYACDGSLADLPTLLRLRDTYGCYLIVDETLSFGAPPLSVTY